MAEPAEIFVSHAPEDNDWCRTLVEALWRAGASVWYGEDHRKDGSVGQDIEGELRARPIFIVILSSASVSKLSVQREVERACYLQEQRPDRITLAALAEQVDIPQSLAAYQRVTGAEGNPINAAEAAQQIIERWGIIPADKLLARDFPFELERSHEAMVTRGNGLTAQKRHDEALTAYEQALSLDPTCSQAGNGKREALFTLRRYDEALTAYQYVLTLDPVNALAWNGKGGGLYYLKDYQEALAAFEQALALNPKISIFWSNKGNTQQGQYTTSPGAL